jgi:hypothetical protein
VAQTARTKFVRCGGIYPVGITLIVLMRLGFAPAQTNPPPAFRNKAAIPAFRKEEPKLRYFNTVLRSRVDEVLDLLVIRASPTPDTYSTSNGGFYCGQGVWLGLFLEERAHPERLFLLTLQHLSDMDLRVLRSSSSELVLARYGDKGNHELNWKFFFDPRSKTFLSDTEFPPFHFLHILRGEGHPSFIAGDLKRLLVVRIAEGPDRAGRPFFALLPLQPFSIRR